MRIIIIFFGFIYLFTINIAFSDSNWDSLIWDEEDWYTKDIQLQGIIVTDITGRQTSVTNAKILIKPLNKIEYSDKKGQFSFTDIPEGVYTIQVITDYFKPVIFENVNITKNNQINLSEVELLSYSNLEIEELIRKERIKWDVNDDGKIGIIEAIKALSIISKLKENSNE